MSPHDAAWGITGAMLGGVMIVLAGLLIWEIGVRLYARFNRYRKCPKCGRVDPITCWTDYHECPKR